MRLKVFVGFRNSHNIAPSQLDKQLGKTLGSKTLGRKTLDDNLGNNANRLRHSFGSTPLGIA
jgi:hypothetical protein